jgi:uncharacterized protein (DUF983 family)
MTAPGAGSRSGEEPAINLGLSCPHCAEPWLRPSNLPGRYRCVYCLHRFELVSVCPNCGEHSTFVRMSSTAMVSCNNCQATMLQPI